MSFTKGNSGRNPTSDRDPDGGRGARKAGKSKITATSYRGRRAARDAQANTRNTAKGGAAAGLDRWG